MTNEKMESQTDLGVALGHSTHFIQRRSNIESGAGVNADLRINVPFVASSPLCELVWSPNKGLHIKCAESSFMDTRPFDFWGAGPSNMFLSPKETITESRTKNGKPMDEHFLKPKTTVHVTGEVLEADWLSKSLRNRAAIAPACESSHERSRGPILRGAVAVLSNKSDELKVNNILQIESFSGNNGGDNQSLVMETVCAPEVHCFNEWEAKSPRKRQASIVAEKRKTKLKKTDNASVPLSPLEKLESTNKNYLFSLIDQDDCVAASKIVPSKATEEVENNREKDKIVSAEDSHTDSRAAKYRSKGKGIASSNRDVDEKMSKGEDCSHESVESSNSGGLFPTGKKQWNFEQLPVHGQRDKNEFQESPGSSSFGRQGSSLMTWISNTINGLGRSDELALAHSHPAGREQTHEKLVMHEKTQDPGIINALVSDSTPSNDSYEKRGSKDIELGAKLYEVDVTPTSYHGENGTVCKQVMLSSCELNESIYKKAVGPSTKPWNLFINSDSILENCNTSCAKNKSSYTMVLCKENGGINSKSSMGKCKTNSSSVNNGLDQPSEGKGDHKSRNKSDPLGSLWLSRFSPKCLVPLSHPDHGNQITVCMKLDCNANNARVSDEHKTVRGRERGPQDAGTYTACHGSNIGAGLESNLKHKLNKMVIANEMISGSTVLDRCIASGSIKNECREERIAPLSFVNWQIPNTPTRTFDAMKRLCLSRTDILKWMSSNMSVSRLDGFFLRLRLGNWEEGVTGTGYQVACIAGSEIERLSRNAVPVNVGGFRCLVESQYISNHDFREEELMAWWCAAWRNGNKIPREEDLRGKMEEKKMLGF